MSEYHPLRELFLARVRQFFREPETIFWVYFFPLILMVGLGLAFRGESSFSVEVYTDDAALAAALEAAEDVEATVRPLGALDASSAAGEEFDLRVVDRESSVDYVLDPTRPNSRLARYRVDDLIQRAAGRVDAKAAELTEVTRPGARYVDWLVPGLMGLNMVGGGLWGVGFVTVDMRIRKLLKRFRATPMRRGHFLLSILGGRMIFLLPEMATILLVAYLAFGVSAKGSWLSVAVVCCIGAVSLAGLGLLLASRAQKLETISGLMNFCMLPMWMFSGVFFSAERFPDAVQPFVQAIPLTQLNNALRGVMLHGESLGEQAVHLSILGAWGAVTYPLALRWFRWQ